MVIFDTSALLSHGVSPVENLYVYLPTLAPILILGGIVTERRPRGVVVVVGALGEFAVLPIAAVVVVEDAVWVGGEGEDDVGGVGLRLHLRLLPGNLMPICWTLRWSLITHLIIN